MLNVAGKMNQPLNKMANASMAPRRANTSTYRTPCPVTPCRARVADSTIGFSLSLRGCFCIIRSLSLRARGQGRLRPKNGTVGSRESCDFKSLTRSNDAGDAFGRD